MVLNIPNGLIMLDGTLSPHEKNLQLALNHNCPPPPPKRGDPKPGAPCCKPMHVLAFASSLLPVEGTEEGPQ